MSADAGQNRAVFDLRPSLLIFLGRDTHAVEEKYVPFSAPVEPLQRIIKLSASDPAEAWDDDLRAAMGLFTAANFDTLARQGMPIQDVIRSIPVLIVIREDGVNRFTDLVRIVVNAAAKSGLSKKLEFITLTAIDDPESIHKRAAVLHGAMASVEHRGVPLQNGVIAICDRWRGGPIGSHVKIEMALARMCALLTLSEYDLEASHLGHFRNGLCGGQTFILGISAYDSGDLKAAAQRIYLSILRDALQSLLGNNRGSIIDTLTDTAYADILRAVRGRIGGAEPAIDTPEWANRRRLYESEVIPKLLDVICLKVLRVEDIIVTLEGLAARLSRRERLTAVGGLAMYLSPPMFTHQNWAVGVILVVVSAITLWALPLWRKRKGKTGDDRFKSPTNFRPDLTEADDTIPSDPILADLLSDLIAEIRIKLGVGPDTSTDDLGGYRSGEVLLGQQLFDLTKIDLAIPRTAGAKELRAGPGRLLLLALESGRWRGPKDCEELVKIQNDTIASILLCLRDEFLKWVWQNEQPRLEDHKLVEQVLYAPPLSDRETIYCFCFAPRNWAIPDMPCAFDRCVLNSSIHFIYLVSI